LGYHRFDGISIFRSLANAAKIYRYQHTGVACIVVEDFATGLIAGKYMETIINTKLINPRDFLVVGLLALTALMAFGYLIKKFDAAKPTTE
jgi:hypothetical protein